MQVREMRRFRLNAPTLAIQYGDGGKGLAVMIPKGAEVATADLPNSNRDDGTSLVKVEWGQKTVSIFLVDLLERGELVDGSGA